MLYCDGIHLISDTSLEELHQWCAKHNIGRHWFHSSQTFPHYDIPKKQRQLFFQQHPEVKQVSSKEIVRLLKTLDRR